MSFGVNFVTITNKSVIDISKALHYHILLFGNSTKRCRKEKWQHAIFNKHFIYINYGNSYLLLSIWSNTELTLIDNF
jgi:hypothetical protein